MLKGYTVIVIYPFISDNQHFAEDVDGAISRFNMHVDLAGMSKDRVITDIVILVHQEGNVGPARVIKRWTKTSGQAEDVNIPFRG